MTDDYFVLLWILDTLLALAIGYIIGKRQARRRYIILKDRRER